MSQLRNQSGQIIVEYILLLIVLVTIATVIVKGLIGRDSRSGVVIATWNGVLATIAQDIPDKVE